MKKVFVVFLTLFILSACQEKKKKPVAVEGVTISHAILPHAVTQPQPLKPTINPLHAVHQKVMYSNHRPDIVEVSPAGVVTPQAVGTAAIAVKIEDGETAAHTVTGKPLGAAVSLNLKRASIFVNGTLPMAVSKNPADAADSIRWSSSDEQKATVSADGIVTGKSAGEAIITAASALTPAFKATCQLTITDQPVAATGMSLYPAALPLALGKTRLLKLVTPTHAPHHRLTYSSDKPAIATVSHTGVVTANAVGEALITVKTEDGAETAACTVTVKPPAKAIKLKLKKVSTFVGGILKITASLKPANAADDIIWTSSDEKIATFSAGLVTGKAVGEVLITAASALTPALKATCQLTITDQPTMTVKNLSLDPAALLLTVGKSYPLKPVIIPAHATNPKVMYSSDKPDVAEVSDKGVVTAKANGKAVITITTEDGGRIVTCTVTVITPLSILR